MWRPNYAKFDSSPITKKTRVTEIPYRIRKFVYCREASTTIFPRLCTILPILKSCNSSRNKCRIELIRLVKSRVAFLALRHRSWHTSSFLAYVIALLHILLLRLRSDRDFFWLQPRTYGSMYDLPPRELASSLARSLATTMVTNYNTARRRN